MKKAYPVFDRGEVETYFSKLPKKEQTEIENYVKYREARGITSVNPLKDLRRHVIQLRFIFEESLSKLTLEDLRTYLALLTRANLKDHTKNDIKINVKNFLKYKFKDWSQRFNELDDIVLSSNTRNEEKINSKTILKKEDIENIMKNETRIFWKAFFMTQYEAGLRTIEVRLLKWDDIKFNIDGEISELNIFATKTKKARPLFIQQATHYLKLLKEQQERTDEKGVYIFHSKHDLNKPIDRNSTSVWQRELSKKAGKNFWAYLLRHSRATELYTLADENKIAENTATSFMGHHKSMKEVYCHMDTDKLKNIIKNQVYKLEDLPPKEKERLERELGDLKKAFEDFKKKLLNKEVVLADEFNPPGFAEVISIKDRIAKRARKS